MDPLDPRFLKAIILLAALVYGITVVLILIEVMENS